MQRILLGAVAVLAIAALVAAVMALDRSGGLGKKMTGNEAGIADLDAKLTRAQNDFARHRDSAARIQSTEKRLNAALAELAALSREIKSFKNQLRSLPRKAPIDRTEISALAKRIEANKGELSKLRQELELAKVELERYRASTMRQRRSVVPSLAAPPAEPKPQPAAKPPSTANRTETGTARKTARPKSDLVSDARRRFQTLDENGDNIIDDMEFRLYKVDALGLIDSNRDGIVTIDETLLSPERFKDFDQDGDGKISTLEFIDSRSFAVIDVNRDNQVTFEEYLGLLRAR